MTENERIREIRKNLKLTQAKFGERVGLKSNSLSQVENGVNAVSDQLRLSICREFNVSEKWLRTGEGEMFVTKPQDELTATMDNLLSKENPDFRRRLALALSDLTDSQWDYLEQFLQGVLNEHTGNSVPATETGKETQEEHERRAFQGMTRKEYHEELDRQLDEQEKEKMTSTFSPSSYGTSSGGGKSA